MLDKETVEHVAKLARLKLSANEISAFSQQLSGILENFQQISSVDTSNVKPIVTPTEMVAYMREDKIEAVANVDELMKNAPEKAGRLFKVPQVVG